LSPDGKLLASGNYSGVVKLWYTTSPAERGRPRPVAPADEDLRTIWNDLGGSDAIRAYEGICRLIHAPAQSVPFRKDHLQPVSHVDPKWITRLLADLDSDEFEVREKASRELAKFEEVTESDLKEFLNSNISSEARRRAERLLAQSQAGPFGEALRALRAVEVLEHIGTPEACQFLESLAQGASAARLTRDAKASLDRLAKRTSSKP
jgi:hypothetical protein